MLGQELTARIDSRGNNVPRNLRVLELPPGVTAAVGDEISLAGEDPTVVGVVTSAAVDPRSGTTIALGFVKRSVGESAELRAGS